MRFLDPGLTHRRVSSIYQAACVADNGSGHWFSVNLQMSAEPEVQGTPLDKGRVRKSRIGVNHAIVLRSRNYTKLVCHTVSMGH